MLSKTLLLALTLAACGDETATMPPGAGSVESKPDAVVPDLTPALPPAAIAVADLQAQAENIALVPSPAEMQKALEKAGVTGGLSALVQERAFKMDAENKDVVAVRTGVLLAGLHQWLREPITLDDTERLMLPNALAQITGECEPAWIARDGILLGVAEDPGAARASG